MDINFVDPTTIEAANFSKALLVLYVPLLLIYADSLNQQYMHVVPHNLSPDSAIGIMAGWPRGQDLNPNTVKSFLFSILSGLALGPIHLPIHCWRFFPQR
jgi:hypothetical protein